MAALKLAILELRTANIALIITHVVVAGFWHTKQRSEHFAQSTQDLMKSISVFVSGMHPVVFIGHLLDQQRTPLLESLYLGIHPANFSATLLVIANYRPAFMSKWAHLSVNFENFLLIRCNLGLACFLDAVLLSVLRLGDCKLFQRAASNIVEFAWFARFGRLRIVGNIFAVRKERGIRGFAHCEVVLVCDLTNVYFAARQSFVSNVHKQSNRWDICWICTNLVKMKKM